jgi:hypothetical protein
MSIFSPACFLPLACGAGERSERSGELQLAWGCPLGLAALAQLVERLTRNEKVESSILSGGSSKSLDSPVHHHNFGVSASAERNQLAVADDSLCLAAGLTVATDEETMRPIVGG